VDEEAAFLLQMDTSPDDADTPLVYADWLDERGDGARAEFLRLGGRLLGMRYRQKGFSDGCGRLLRLGRALPADWVARVSRPALTGTCWHGTDSSTDRYVWRFLPGGVANYTSHGGTTYQNSTWRQYGCALVMETNRHYAEYECYVSGDELYGKARNVTGYRWRFVFRRTTDPELVAFTDPHTTVYDDHLRDNPRRAKRRL
jgi:uncharacterized protein (TIGR02996 family)